MLPFLTIAPPIPVPQTKNITVTGSVDTSKSSENSAPVISSVKYSTIYVGANSDALNGITLQIKKMVI